MYGETMTLPIQQIDQMVLHEVRAEKLEKANGLLRERVLYLEKVLKEVFAKQSGKA